MSSETPTVPLCACGCSQPVKVRRYASQGQPRFLQGHQHKGSNNGNYRGGKIKACCPVCLTEFLKHPSQNQVTCRREVCYREWQRLTTSARGQNRVTLACHHCGKELRRYPSQAKERNYCNRHCQNAAIPKMAHLNGHWKGGMWRFVQEQVRMRDGYRCLICGFDLATDIHHITPRHLDGTDEYSNLVTLCPNHHKLADKGIISVEHLRNTSWEPSQSPASRSHTPPG